MSLFALLLTAAVARDVGVPLDPLSGLPWEAATDGICGATTTYDGAIVMYRWWVRAADGRLERIVNQQVGRPSVTEQRFVYEADGRVVGVEQWETGEGVLVLSHTEPVVRDARGRPVDGVSAATIERSPDGREVTETWPGHYSLVWTLDDRGAPLTVRATTNGRPEIETWHRDCAAFPAVPAPPGA